MTAVTALEAVRDRVIAPYDAVVILLGLNEARRFVSPPIFRQHGTALLRFLSDATHASTQLVAVGIPPVRSTPGFDIFFGPLVDRHARKLNSVLRDLVADFPRASYVRLPEVAPPPRGTHRTAERSQLCGQSIAAQLAGKMSPGRSIGAKPRRRPLDEKRRQEALDRLEVMHTAREPRFDRIVELTRILLDVPFAAITLIDRDRQWMKSSAGFPRTEIRREDGYCQFTIAGCGATVVADARRDPVLMDLATVKTDGLVFYAGYPLESPDGQPLGALCVFDTEPRQGNSVNIQDLRDLALLAQREVWGPARIGQP
jgi:GAF domain-containing protein